MSWEVVNVVYEYSGIRNNPISENIPIKLEVSKGYDDFAESFKKTGVYPVVLFPGRKLDLNLRSLKQKLNYINDVEF